MIDKVVPGAREIRSVLHPTDLTAASELAFVHALRMALPGRSKLYLLHADASDSGETDWSEFPPVRQTLVAWGMLKEGSSPRAVFDELGVKAAKIRVPDRDAIRAILRFLDDHPSQVIVLQPAAATGCPAGCMARSPSRWPGPPRSNTLFIPHDARGFVAPKSGAVSLRRILIPIDQQPRPSAAVQAAWQLSRLFGAEGVALHLVYVGENAEMPILEVEPEQWACVERSVLKGDVVEEFWRRRPLARPT